METIINSISEYYIKELLNNCQWLLLTELKYSPYSISTIKTDINGNIHFKLERNISCTLCLKEETVYMFIDNVFYNKQLMSLKLLKYSSILWFNNNHIENASISNYNTYEDVLNNTACKYLTALSDVGINTKNIFT